MDILKSIKSILELIIHDIDTDNSNISESEQEDLLNFLQKINSKELSKLEAAAYLNISRATFDNYVKDGKLPKGKKRMGFKELSWNKNDLNNFLKCQK